MKEKVVRVLTRLVVVANLLFASQFAAACSCKPNVPLADRSAHADVILVAEVVGKRLTGLESVSGPVAQTIVRPIEVFKGQVPKTVSIASAGVAGCDSWSSPPPVGGRYLLYLSRLDGELRVKICSSPALVTENTQELIQLRKLFGHSPRTAGHER